MNAEMTATATVATLETLTIADLTLADGSLREVGYYDLPREARNVGAVQNGIYRVNEQVRKYNAGIARDVTAKQGRRRD